MINKDTVFTITYLFKDGEKTLLFKKGEVPAKVSDEADACLCSSNEEEAEAIEKVLEKIPLFKDAEEGSEESITKELRELEDEYGFTLETVEEEIGKDLDNDSETEESEEHEEAVEEKKEEDEETDPSEVVIEATYNAYTNPYDYDYSDDEVVEESSDYQPILSTEEFLAEVDELDEAIDAYIPVFLARLRNLLGSANTVSPLTLDALFNELKIPKFDDKRLQYVLMATKETADLYLDNSGNPFLKGKSNGFSSEGNATLITLPQDNNLDSAKRKILSLLVNNQ